MLYSVIVTHCTSLSKAYSSFLEGNKFKSSANTNADLPCTAMNTHLGMLENSFSRYLTPTRSIVGVGDMSIRGSVRVNPVCSGVCLCIALIVIGFFFFFKVMKVLLQPTTIPSRNGCKLAPKVCVFFCLVIGVISSNIMRGQMRGSTCFHISEVLVVHEFLEKFPRLLLSLTAFFSALLKFDLRIVSKVCEHQNWTCWISVLKAKKHYSRMGKKCFLII